MTVAGRGIQVSHHDDGARSRVKVFFRIILVIPHVIWLALWGIGIVLVLPVHWIIALIRGRPAGWEHAFYAAYVRVPIRVEQVREFTDAPNAYAFGLGGSRRVVLWDTLARGDFSRREVRAVVAHELGHHRHDHIAKQIGWFALLVVPAALAVFVATRRRGLADPAAVPVALFVVVVLNLLTTPLHAAASRRYEAEADWAALEATGDPRAMETLHKRFIAEGLADPDPPGWLAALFDSHPSGLERVAMARAARELSRP